MMVEQASFDVNSSQGASSYHPYPPPLSTYDEVVASSQLFIETLKKLHLSMGTKFMNPVVGGRDLDLHRLFVEVTSRGGITKVLKDRRWREVTAVFNFPSSATNASSYSANAMATATAPRESVAQQIHVASPQQKPNTSTSITEESLAATSSGSRVCGVIDGKFDGGYLITVKMGSEEFKGVLYQVPENENFSGPHKQELLKSTNNYPSLQLGQTRRKRRKKCEIRKRDPAHPKPNRSGYNFFFAEQHARLKPLYHGKDREISRIIGESWNKLQEPDRSVYQEKALKDKERYKMEMEGYRERLRTGQMIPVVGSTQEQRSPPLPINLMDLNSINIQSEGGPTSAAYTEDNETSSDKSNNLELEYESGGDKEDEEYDNFGEYSHELKNVDIEIMADEGFSLQTRQLHGTRDERSNINDDVALGNNNNPDGVSVPVEEKIEQPPINVDDSVPN